MIDIDARDVEMVRAALQKLPGDIRAKAFARAMRRVGETVRTRLVRRQAPRLKLAQKVIRERTFFRLNAGGHTQDLVVRSGWIPLYRLGATQTSRGVRVRLRGSYRHAFLASMKNGHRGVFLREGMARLPITELFGPNPAHDITNNDAVYVELMAEVLEEVLAPRILHEVGRLLPR